MSKIIVEYHGFLKFVNYAQHRAIDWFGPYCNYDPCQIITMSARDWDGMVDEERLYFIREHYLDSPNWKDKLPANKNSFLSFLLDRSFGSDEHPIQKASSYLNSGSNLSREYRLLTKEQRQMYSNLSLPELGMKRILERRDKLHKLYSPLELNKLEYIIKTLPRKPKHPRIWFHVLKNASLNPSLGQASWTDLSPEQKSFYEDCTRVDRRRYKYEKMTWLTRLSQLDFSSSSWTLNDFQLTEVRSQLEALNTIIDLNKDRVPSSVRVGRPMSSFALFVKDFYSEKTKKTTYSKDSIRKPVEAWYQLPEEKRQEYKARSVSLFDLYKSTQTSESDKLDLDSISRSLFKHLKDTTVAAKPSSLISKKLPSIEDFYGRTKGIKKQLRKESWNSLSQKEKDDYIKEYEILETNNRREQDELEEKLRSLKDLIVMAKKLRETKRELGLIKSDRRISKGLYPELNDM